MNYFVVFQKKSYKAEYDRCILWAPKTDNSGGKAKFYWQSLKLCEPGDVVFSVVKNIIVARAIVVHKFIDAKNPFNDNSWRKDGWLVEVDYSFAINSIKITSIIDKIRELLPKKYSPFQSISGKGNQGYLYQISEELGYALDDYVLDVYKPIKDSDVFTVTKEQADIISRLYDEAGLSEGNITLIEEVAPTESNKPKTKISRVNAKKTDFVEKTKENIRKGIRAEMLVVNYEKEELIKAGKTDLADQVRWVAKKADGYGYDVLSYSTDGKEKYIEVKGTDLMRKTPFYISSNELETSIKKSDRYWIYRVYYLQDNKPKFYKLQGRIDKHFELVASNYKAYNKG